MRNSSISERNENLPFSPKKHEKRLERTHRWNFLWAHVFASRNVQSSRFVRKNLNGSSLSLLSHCCNTWDVFDILKVELATAFNPIALSAKKLMSFQVGTSKGYFCSVFCGQEGWESIEKYKVRAAIKMLQQMLAKAFYTSEAIPRFYIPAFLIRKQKRIKIKTKSRERFCEHWTA